MPATCTDTLPRPEHLLSSLRTSDTPETLYDRCFATASQLADLTAIDHPDSQFWASMSEACLTPLLAAASFEPTRELSDIFRWATDENDATVQEVTSTLHAFVDAGGERRVLTDWQWVSGLDPRLRHSIYVTNAANVEAYMRGAVAAAAH